MQIALSRAPAAPGDLDKQLFQLKQALLELDGKLFGNRSKQQVGEKTKPTIGSRLRFAMGGTTSSTYGPTPAHKRSLEIAATQFRLLKAALEKMLNKQLSELEKALTKAGAPWTEGQPIPEY